MGRSDRSDVAGDAMRRGEGEQLTLGRLTLRHVLNRSRRDGRSMTFVSVVGGRPTAMLCGAGATAKHSETAPTCPECRALLDMA